MHTPLAKVIWASYVHICILSQLNCHYSLGCLGSNQHFVFFSKSLLLFMMLVSLKTRIQPLRAFTRNSRSVAQRFAQNDMLASSWVCLNSMFISDFGVNLTDFPENSQYLLGSFTIKIQFETFCKE